LILHPIVKVSSAWALGKKVLSVTSVIFGVFSFQRQQYSKGSFSFHIYHVKLYFAPRGKIWSAENCDQFMSRRSCDQFMSTENCDQLMRTSVCHLFMSTDKRYPFMISNNCFQYLNTRICDRLVSSTNLSQAFHPCCSTDDKGFLQIAVFVIEIPPHTDIPSPTTH